MSSFLHVNYLEVVKSVTQYILYANNENWSQNGDDQLISRDDKLICGVFFLFIL